MKVAIGFGGASQGEQIVAVVQVPGAATAGFVEAVQFGTSPIGIGSG